MIVMLVGGIMAHNASTSNGTVEVHSVEWINENGASICGTCIMLPA